MHSYRDQMPVLSLSKYGLVLNRINNTFLHVETHIQDRYQIFKNKRIKTHISNWTPFRFDILDSKHHDGFDNTKTKFGST